MFCDHLNELFVCDVRTLYSGDILVSVFKLQNLITYGRQLPELLNSESGDVRTWIMEKF